jgi:hypothetical protein
MLLTTNYDTWCEATHENKKLIKKNEIIKIIITIY